MLHAKKVVVDRDQIHLQIENGHKVIDLTITEILNCKVISKWHKQYIKGITSLWVKSMF